MKTQTCWPMATIALAVLLVSLVSSSSFARQLDFDREALKIRDSVTLKSGSTLNGRVTSEGVDDNGRKFIIFATEDGTIMKLDLSRAVYRGKYRKADMTDKEYNTRIMKLKDDPNAHWDICNWLDSRPSGAIRFKNQIRFHLERIMELDPNDDKAKKELGYIFLRDEDRWVPERQFYASIGYEKNGTSWSPKRQARISAQYETNASIEGERKQAFRRWEREANRKNPNLAALRTELFRICDAPAVTIIFAAARKEKSAARRAMFIEAIGRVPTKAAQNALCVFAVEEDVIGNRERALTLLSNEHYNQESAVAFLTQYFPIPGKPPVLRVAVRRAAFAIGELGSESAMLVLVDNLVTEHVVKQGDDPNRQQIEQNSRGEFNFGGGAKTETRQFRHNEVVTALKKISNQDYGFNAAAWRAWYIKNHTSYNVRTRR